MQSRESVPLLDPQHEAALLRFEEAWESGQAPSLQDYWQKGDPMTLLIELVHIELERRYRSGQAVSLEKYLETFPELRSHETLLSLIRAEQKLRHRHGLGADQDAYRRRFPDVADRLDDDRLSTVPGMDVTGNTPSESAPQGDATIDVPPPACAEAFRWLERLGRYRIVKQLGKGGMGAVFLAEDEQLQRRVGLKIPHLAVDADPTVRKRFLTEARAAATLRHAHICPVYDVGEAGGMPYLTMAYIDGVTLYEHLKATGPLAPDQAATLVRKLALALNEAHQQGIIHRDLKPSNVMLDKHGEPVLMDFGLARREAPAQPHLTSHGNILGTPAYMAPEQAEGNIAAIGPATDIYGLGAILYELLAGRPPFQGATGKVFSQILNAPPEALTRLRPDLDPLLEELCLTALAKDPARRFSSMSEFATALIPWIEGTAPSAVPKRRRPRRWLATLGAAVVLLFGSIIYVTTNHGTVEIQLSDPAAKVEVKIDGEDIRLVHNGEIIRLRVGNHKLVAVSKDFESVGESVTIKRGGREVFRVALKPKAGARAGISNRAVQENVKTFLRAGREFLKKGQLVEAIRAANEALRLNAECAAAHLMLGEAYYRQGKRPESLLEATKAIDLNPLLADAYVLRSVVHLNSVSPDQAINDATEALRLDPKQYNAYANRGCAHADKGDFRKGIADYDRAIAGLGTATSHHWFRGLIHARLGNHVQAKADRDVAVKLDPSQANRAFTFERSDVWPHLMLAFACKNQGQYEQMIPHCNEALKLDPSSPLAHHLRGWAYGHLGQLKEALQDIDETLRLEPAHPEAQFSRFLAYVAAGQYEQGIAAFTEAIHQNPETRDSRRFRAFLYGCQGLFEKALADCDEEIRLFSTAVGYWARAEVHAMMGDLVRAKADFDRAVQFDHTYRNAFVLPWASNGGHQPKGASREPASVSLVPGHQLRGHTAQVRCLSFSPDGRLALSGGWDGTARIWDARNGRQLGVFAGHAECVECVAVTPDGRRAVSGGGGVYRDGRWRPGIDYSLRLWDVTTGRELRRYAGHTAVVFCVAVSSDGWRAVTGSHDGTIALWDLRKDGRERILSGHRGPIESVAFSKDGRYAMSASWDRDIRVWDVETGNCFQVLSGHSQGLNGVAWGPNGHEAISASTDKTLRLWDIVSGKERHRSNHPTGVWRLAAVPNLRRAVTLSGARPRSDGGAEPAGYDNNVRLWDLDHGKELGRYEFNGPVASVAAAPDRRNIWIGRTDGTIQTLAMQTTDRAEAAVEKVLDALLPRVSVSLPNFQGEVHRFDASSSHSCQVPAFSPDGRTLAVSIGDGTYRLWDVPTGKQVRAWRGHADQAFGIAFSPDGKNLASTGSDQPPVLWDAATGEKRHIFKGLSRFLNNVLFSPDGKQLAAGSDGSAVEVWDSANGTRLGTFAHTTLNVIGLAFTPDGKSLISAGGSWEHRDRQGEIKVWDLAKREVRFTFPGKYGGISWLALSPDGKTLASAGMDRKVRLWETETGKSLAVLEGHADSVVGVAFTPDGKTLASSCKDGTIRLWTVSKRALRATLIGHRGAALRIAFQPNGRLLVSTGADGTVRLWQVPPLAD
jgi:WD40 repeat protein/tetratricopeptide (TPR) repeat protein